MATQASNTNLFPNLARILVVDDEVLIADTICLALTEEGYDVTTLQDGRLALSLLTSNSKNTDLSNSSTPQPFDLLILDLMLPGVNGLDICRLLRREGINILILILSARGSETDRVHLEYRCRGHQVTNRAVQNRFFTEIIHAGRVQ